MVVLVFNFEGKIHTVFHSDYTKLHPTNSTQRFPFLQIFIDTCYLLLFL